MGSSPALPDLRPALQLAGPARPIASVQEHGTAGAPARGRRPAPDKALAAAPASADELAAATQTNSRYIAEWLRGQAAGGYVEYDPATDTYSMTEEQSFALADPDGGVYAPGAFVLALGTLRAEPRITDAFRTGAGLGWHEHDGDVFTGCERTAPGWSSSRTRPTTRPTT